MRNRLAVLGATVFAGFLAASYIASPVICFILFAAAGAAALVSRKRKALLLALAGLSAAFLIYGIYTLVYIRPVQALSGQTREVTAKVAEVSVTGNDKVLVTVNGDAGGVPVKFSFFYPDIGMETGDSLKASVKFSEPTAIAAYSENLNYSDGVFMKAAVCELYITEKGSGFSAVNAIRDYSRYLRDITAEELPGEEGALILAMCFGDKSRLDADLSACITNSGLSHMTAVSGMHISLVVTVFVSLLGSLGADKRRYADFAAALVISAALSVFFGMTPSVCRSCIMLIIYHSSKLFLRRNSSANALGLASLVLLLTEPCACRDAGLILSFCATIGAGTVSGAVMRFTENRPTVGKSRPKRHLLPEWLRHVLLKTFVVCVCAAVCTVPASAVIFGRLSLMSVPASLVMAPLFFCVMMFAVTAACTGGLLAPVMLLPAGLLAKLMIVVIRLFGSFRFASIRLDGGWVMPFIAVTALFLAAVFLISAKSRRRRLIAVCAVSTVVCVFAGAVTLQRFSDKDMTRIRIYSDGREQVTAVENGTGISAFSTGVNKKLSSAAYRMLRENGAEGFELLAVLERKKRRSMYSNTFETMTAREKHFLDGGMYLYDIGGNYSVLVSDRAVCMEINGVNIVLTDSKNAENYPGNDIAVYSGSSAVKDTGCGITVSCGKRAGTETYNAYYNKTEILIDKAGRISVRS